MPGRSDRGTVPLIVLLLAMLAPGSSSFASSSSDILEQIRGLPGVMTAIEAPSDLPETRFFQIEFEQPLNLEEPAGAKFLQRMTLLHRSEAAPMVLALNGYDIDWRGSLQYELTALLQANQIHVEHRFFLPSGPDPLTWNYLTIAQSAADHHRIVEAFKSIYAAKWLSTGSSKGGMASVYHRFFYPDDVDATVAYVAPSSHGTQDERYVSFVDSLGTEECRSKLRAVQKRALKKRAKLVRFIKGSGYNMLGKDRALEFAIMEFPFVFWQYGSASSCDAIPGSEASPREIFDYLGRVASVSGFNDDTNDFYAPYYYQAATELGGPRFSDTGVRALLRYPGEDVPSTYPPLGIEKIFKPAVMPQIEQWVLNEGERFLFIYGENDPWSATAFEGKASNDSYRFFVTGARGNHRARILDLSTTDRDFVLERIQTWLGVSIPRGYGLHLFSDPRLRIDPPSRRELFLR